MFRTIKVEIAKRQYEVQQLPSGASTQWRARFSEPVTALLGALDGMGSLPAAGVRDLVPIVRAVAGTLLGSMELVHEAVFAYSPALAADRARILAEGYDDEIVAAFMQILRLVYPFEGVLDLIRSGLKGTGT